MKLAICFFGSVIAIASFTAGHLSAASKKDLNARTAKNLSSAMHGEAFAHAKYLLFAEHARKSGDIKLANLFEQTAKTERFEHFSEEAELLGLVGSDADNLRDALKGEAYESETMYRDFAQQARQAGDSHVADRFEEIRKDETMHHDAFVTALNELTAAHQHASLR